MPKGGPNIAAHQARPGSAPTAANARQSAQHAPWAPKAPPQESFTGDVAIQALRRRLALEPDVVPQPPIVMRREQPLPWIARLGFICLAAGVGAFCITALSVTDVYSPDAGRNAAGGFVPVTASTDVGDITPARLVVEGGRASTNDPVSLGVTLNNATGNESVFLSGLENGTRLTAGVPLGSKGWRISARDIGSVLAYAPVDYVGAMHAAINLHAANNSVVDTQVVRLEWLPKADRNPAQQAKLQPPAPQPPAPQRPQLQEPPPAAATAPNRVAALRLEPDEMMRLISRGQQLMQSGDIAAARSMLQRAAAAGNAQAALLLGGTYDPVTLRELGVLGFPSNAALAREWYEKALALGAPDARRRLDRLAQSR